MPPLHAFPYPPPCRRRCAATPCHTLPPTSFPKAVCCHSFSPTHPTSLPQAVWFLQSTSFIRRSRPFSVGFHVTLASLWFVLAMVVLVDIDGGGRDDNSGGGTWGGPDTHGFILGLLWIFDAGILLLLCTAIATRKPLAFFRTLQGVEIAPATVPMTSPSHSQCTPSRSPPGTSISAGTPSPGCELTSPAEMSTPGSNHDEPTFNMPGSRPTSPSSHGGSMRLSGLSGYEARSLIAAAFFSAGCLFCGVAVFSLSM